MGSVLLDARGAPRLAGLRVLRGETFAAGDKEVSEAEDVRGLARILFQLVSGRGWDGRGREEFSGNAAMWDLLEAVLGGRKLPMKLVLFRYELAAVRGLVPHCEPALPARLGEGAVRKLAFLEEDLNSTSGGALPLDAVRARGGGNANGNGNGNGNGNRAKSGARNGAGNGTAVTEARRVKNSLAVPVVSGIDGGESGQGASHGDWRKPAGGSSDQAGRSQSADRLARNGDSSVGTSSGMVASGPILSVPVASSAATANGPAGPEHAAAVMRATEEVLDPPKASDISWLVSFAETHPASQRAVFSLLFKRPVGKKPAVAFKSVGLLHAMLISSQDFAVLTVANDGFMSWVEGEWTVEKMQGKQGRREFAACFQATADVSIYANLVRRKSVFHRDFATAFSPSWAALPTLDTCLALRHAEAMSSVLDIAKTASALLEAFSLATDAAVPLKGVFVPQLASELHGAAAAASAILAKMPDGPAREPAQIGLRAILADAKRALDLANASRQKLCLPEDIELGSPTATSRGTDTDEAGDSDAKASERAAKKERKKRKKEKGEARKSKKRGTADSGGDGDSEEAGGADAGPDEDEVDGGVDEVVDVRPRGNNARSMAAAAASAGAAAAATAAAVASAPRPTTHSRQSAHVPAGMRPSPAGHVADEANPGRRRKSSPSRAGNGTELRRLRRKDDESDSDSLSSSDGEDATLPTRRSGKEPKSGTADGSRHKRNGPVKNPSGEVSVLPKGDGKKNRKASKKGRSSSARRRRTNSDSASASGEESSSSESESESEESGDEKPRRRDKRKSKDVSNKGSARESRDSAARKKDDGNGRAKKPASASPPSGKTPVQVPVPKKEEPRGSAAALAAAASGRKTPKMDRRFEIEPHEVRFAEQIGSGGFGVVFRGKFRGQLVAIKKIHANALSNAASIAEFQSEVAVLCTLAHPNILKFMGACVKPPNLMIVTEFMARGTLFDILHQSSMKVTWAMRRRMALDSCRGMRYLHDSKLLHRDLKSSNIMVDENFKCAIGDFGLTRISHGAVAAQMTGQCGTFQYMAPEILSSKPYSEKADVFSFGILLWELVARKLPFFGMQPMQVGIAVSQQGLRPTMPPKCPAPLEKLMRACWDQNPNKRPSFAQVQVILEAMPDS